MSSFTSWGSGSGLELKPEITAPGGNIWSTVMDSSYVEGAGKYDDYTGSYSLMSGTSMATPHMAGLAALVEQYVKSQHPQQDAAASADLTNHLLVSTAVPQQENGVYVSPRRPCERSRGHFHPCLHRCGRQAGGQAGAGRRSRLERQL